MWLERYPAPSRHECVLPSPFAAGMGSVWMCDDCGKRYRVVTLVAGAGQRNGDYEWMTVPAEKPFQPGGAPHGPTSLPAKLAGLEPGVTYFVNRQRTSDAQGSVVFDVEVFATKIATILSLRAGNATIANEIAINAIQELIEPYLKERP